jgi:hypothetical protein
MQVQVAAERIWRLWAYVTEHAESRLTMLSHSTKQTKLQGMHGRGKGGSDTHERSRNEKPVAFFGHAKDRCRSRKLPKESADAYLRS